MHIIIVGAGEVGRYLAEILAEEQQDVFVIEQNEHRVREVGESIDAQVLHGSGASRSVLERAHIDQADLLLAVTEVDEVNLIAAMTAQRMNHQCRTVARVRNDHYLRGADALRASDYDIDVLLGPERAVASQVFHTLSYNGPGQVSLLAEDKLQLLDLPVQPHSTLPLVSMEEIRGEMPNDALIVAILGDEGLRIAKPDDRFKVNERVFILSAAGAVNGVLTLMGSDQHSVDRVLIVGGGNIGYQVATELEQSRYDVTVIERDRDRAEKLATQLGRALVLQGDGTDPELLAEQIREGHDAVVVLLQSDSESLLAGIVANHYGAKKVVVRVDNQEYGAVSRKLGVDSLISPRRAIADEILRYARRSHIVSTTMLGNHQGEVIDFAIDKASRPQLLDKPLSSIKLPDDCLVGVITGDGTLAVPGPDNEVQLRSGDHVFAAALREAVPKIEQLFG